MDPELLAIIRKMASERSFTMLRHVGRRVEVHFSGDYEPTVFTYGEVDVPKEVKKMKLVQLRQLAGELEINPKGLKKADLISEIERVYAGTELESEGNED